MPFGNKEDIPTLSLLTGFVAKILQKFVVNIEENSRIFVFHLGAYCLIHFKDYDNMELIISVTEEEAMNAQIDAHVHSTS